MTSKQSLALWHNNFALNYSPPPDPAKMALPRTTVAMTVKLRMEQVVIWVHQQSAYPLLAGLKVSNLALNMKKTMQLITDVHIATGSVLLHGRWQPQTDGRRNGFSFSVAYGLMCSGGRSARAARGSRRQRECGCSSNGGGQQRAAIPPAPAPVSGDDDRNPIDLQLKIAAPAGLPDEISIDLGRQAFTPTPIPILSLADFGLHAAAAALEVLLELPPSKPKEQQITLRIALLQLLIPEVQLSPDGLATPMHSVVAGGSSLISRAYRPHGSSLSTRPSNHASSRCTSPRHSKSSRASLMRIMLVPVWSSSSPYRRSIHHTCPKHRPLHLTCLPSDRVTVRSIRASDHANT